MKPLIAPSVLAANFANLQSEIQIINVSEADWIHFDVMDGVFVPNISFGFPILEAVKQYAEKMLDVHLMIQEPERYIEAFKKSGADSITVHYEACTHLHRTIQQIKDTGCKAGVALNPHTPVQLLEDIITEVDLVLIMSVNPGFGGQKFIPATLNKLSQARQLIDQSGLPIRLEIDGGVTVDNIAEIAAAGADMFVAGSAIFNTDNYQATIAEFSSALQKASH